MLNVVFCYLKRNDSEVLVVKIVEVFFHAKKKKTVIKGLTKHLLNKVLLHIHLLTVFVLSCMSERN